MDERVRCYDCGAMVPVEVARRGSSIVGSYTDSHGTFGSVRSTVDLCPRCAARQAAQWQWMLLFMALAGAGFMVFLMLGRLLEILQS